MANGFSTVLLRESERGLHVPRVFTKAGENPFDSVKWKKTSSVIKNPDGSVVFEMHDIEVPEFWSQVATDILAQKYFRKTGVPQLDATGKPILDPYGRPVLGSETSARQTLHRLAGCWRYWGEKHGYFASPEDAQAFYDEVAYMLVHQMAAPNSPQWFNTGLNWSYGLTGPAQGHYYVDPQTGQALEAQDSYTHPQAHACFILTIKDDLVNPGGILDFAVREARIFKFGSGSGANFSMLRGKGEPLSGGGKSSGAMSFLKIFDTVAGSIKSGGTTRRAAKMAILDMDHPEIEDFIEWKAREEKKVAALIKAGYASGYEGEAYQTASGQNSNNSVRVPDSFMHAVVNDNDWNLTARTNGKVMKTARARDLWEKIGKAAWESADPGVQYDTTINDWHTCPASGKQRATNPCVTGDTKVLIENGEWVRIDKLAEDGDAEILSDVRTLDNGNGLKLTGLIKTKGKVWKTGTKEVCVLTTINGRTIKATSDHKFLTQSGWKELCEIKQGENICMQTGDGNALVDVVSSIEMVGIEDVYDISEPLTHSFIANEFVVHNCSEYMFLDNTACNLASINLMKFYDTEKMVFDAEKFKHAARLWTIILEISVLMAGYPSKEIAEGSYKFRTLGLGYANLGAMLMVGGIPYDSDDARAICAAITGIMTGESYATSAELAAVLGTFPEYDKNREHMLRVIRNHRRVVYNAKPEEYEQLSTTPQGLNHKFCPQYLLSAAIESWDRALALGENFGYRNAQTTLIAPTGTIALQMDCDTTGIEPDFALVKFKKLAGGGYFKIINQSVEPALRNLGYTGGQISDVLRYVLGTNSLRGAPFVNDISLKKKGLTDEDLAKVEKILSSVMDISFAFNPMALGEDTFKKLGIKPEQYNSPSFSLLKSFGFTEKEIEAATEYICGTMTVEGAPHLREEHYAVFDCANKCGRKGQRFIAPMGHVRIMSVAQPLLSGSISKTVNMPHEVSIEDIKEIYFQAWKFALKSIAIYRDGSKLSQPLSTTMDAEKDIEQTSKLKPQRRRLPDERQALTHKFRIGNQEGYLTCGLYPDSSLGEIFVTMSKEGSVVSGLMDSLATAISISLQYGVPLKVMANKFIHTRFEPSGFTDNPDIKMARSIMDYIFRYLALKFLPPNDQEALGVLNGNGHAIKEETIAAKDEIQAPPRPTVSLIQPSVFRYTKENPEQEQEIDRHSDAPPCYICGTLMIRSGSCYLCLNCGANSGCA